MSSLNGMRTGPHGIRIGRPARPMRGPARSDSGLLLVGHGSRCAVSEDETHLFADLVSAHVPQVALEVGFLEMTHPSADAALDRLVARGCTDITVLPLALLAAGHAKSDAPAVVIAARQRHPHVQIRFGSPFGVAREPVELLGKAVVASGGAGLPLLVVARGSSDPDANSDAHKAARLVAEWTGSPFVHVGFSGITGPSVQEAASVFGRLGHRRVAVVWWFLCHGKLIERGRQDLADVMGGAGVDYIDAGYIGPDPALVPLVLERYRSAASSGPAPAEPVRCDLCAYRAPWPGREERVGQPVGVGHSHLAAHHH
ncbi:MAG TPA: sirohydrochlorin chelatase [Acidimicrobiales bacterium]|nr:sirohydrochlorin chelatase [Acidimicrobiales bacterium]